MYAEVSISASGAAGGHLVLEATDAIPGDDILPFKPEIQSILDEITSRGWRYIFAETRATAVAELDLGWCNYSIKPAHPDDPAPEVRNSPEYLLELDIGATPLKLTAITKLQAFSVSISSKTIPRASTVDLVNGVVTQVADQFWKWEEGWEKDQRRLSEGLESYEVVSWLVGVKRFRLAENFSAEHFQELSRAFEEYHGSGTAPTSSPA